MNLSLHGIAVLTVLKDEMDYWKKSYCYPSQMRITRELAEKVSVHRSRRTVNRWLRKLEEAQIIRRQRRLKHHPIKGLMFKSTLYYIGWLGYELLRHWGKISMNEYRQKMAELREKERIRKEKPESETPSGLASLFSAPTVNLKTF